MSLKVRKFNAQVRDSTTGDMIPAGLLSSDALGAINTAKNTAVSAVQSQQTTSVNAVTSAGTAAVANFPATAASCDTLAGDFAATYVPDQAYAVGDYCTYQYQLYQCKTPIAANTDHTFETSHWNSITVDDLKRQLFNNTDTIIYKTEIGFITTSNATTDYSVVSNTSYSHAVIDCSEGDIFCINGTGAASQKLWAFVENDGTIISPAAPTNATLSYEIIIAPQDAVKLVVNFVGNGFISKQVPLAKRIDKIENSLSAEIDATNELVGLKSGTYVNKVIPFYQGGLTPAGKLVPGNAKQATSDYIYIPNGATITKAVETGYATSNYWWYTENKEYINNTSSGNPSTNAKYTRIVVSKSDNSNITLSEAQNNTTVTITQPTSLMSLNEEFDQKFDQLLIKETVNNWEKGNFNTTTGANVTNDAYIRNQNFYGIFNGTLKIEVPNGYLMLLYAWELDGSFVGSYKTTGIFDTTTSNYEMISSFECADFPNYKIKISFRRDPTSSEINISEGQNCALYFQTDKTLSNEGKPADAKLVGDEINSIKTQLFDNTDTVIYKTETGYIVTTNATTNYSVVADESYSHAIIDCSEGDIFCINGTGGELYQRLWAFVENDGTIINPRATNSATLSYETIIAPQSAVKLVVNFVGSGFVSKQVPLVKRIDKIENSLSAEIDVTNELVGLKSGTYTNKYILFYHGGLTPTGEFVPGNANAAVTDYIYIPDGATITKAVETGYATSNFWCYTESKEFIRNGVTTPPDGTKYVRFVVTKSDSSAITLSEVQNNTTVTITQPASFMNSMYATQDWLVNGNVEYNDDEIPIAYNIIWADGVQGHVSKSVFDSDVMEYTTITATHDTNTITYHVEFDENGYVTSESYTIS